MQKLHQPVIRLFLLIAVCFLACVSPSATAQQVIKKNRDHDTLEIRSLLDRAARLVNTFPDSAGDDYQKAITLAFALKSKRLLATSMGLQIRLLNGRAKFEEALSLARQHILMADKLHDSALLLQACNEAANEYEYLGDYQPSTEYYIKALKLAVATSDSRMQAKLNNNLSSVFLALKNYGTAYRYSTRAYQMSTQQKDTVTIGNCLINMGLSELHQQKFEQALDHFDKAEKIGYHIPDITLVADALSDKGLVYYTKHDLNAAENAYKEQRSIADKYDLPYEKLYAVFQLAVVAKAKGNFPLAENFASKAITIGEQIGTADELMEMYDTMAVIKQKTGKFREAFYYKNKYEAINDSITNEEVQTNIHHLNIQYRSAQKDKQIAEQNLNIERSRAAIERKNMWMFISLAGVLTLVAILLLSWRNYRHKQKLHHQSLATLQKQHEVNTLKARMQAREEERDRIGREMHDDIGSALTTILYLSDDLKSGNTQTAVRSADRIGETATAVVDKMNEIIWSMNCEYDTYDDLIAYTRQHAVQFLRDHGLQYHLDIPDPVPQVHLSGEQRRNIYLVIKEALHNVVKHACATKVTISFLLNHHLHIYIHDDGKGLKNISQFGNGLKNMRYRMESIGGHFDISIEEGTTLKLECPVDVNT